MTNNNELTIDPETGYYAYPERPTKLPQEDEYPRKYSVKNFTPEEITDFRYQRSIRGYSINRMGKGEVNVLSKDGILETKPGWIPGESGLIFRSLAIGLIKLSEGWIVIERNTGISLMPDIVIENKEPESLQLSFDFMTKPKEKAKDKETPWFHSKHKATGTSREKALTLAETHVENFTKKDWIEIHKKLDYDLAGIEFEIIRTPEQERIESEWADACIIINEANDLKRETNNFYAIYKGLRIHENSKDQPEMTNWKKTKSSVKFRIGKKINNRKKTKFFFAQESYHNSIEVEGIILPIEIKGLPEMKELIITRHDQFKETPAKGLYTGSKYSVFEPYVGIPIIKNVNTIKSAKEEVIERLKHKITPEGVKSLSTRFQEHNEKIIASQSGADITPFLQSDIKEKDEKQAA